ncbi:MAG: MarR family transcriptional regulator [Clostridia bacterium]|nr:MarR family transcriptional regulator [Clostridia bacterium]
MNESKLCEAINMMIKTDHMHRALIDCRVSTLGVHRTHHRILMHLAKHDKVFSQKELAEHLDITPAAVTGALKKIEKDGYIERTLGQDNRFNELRITEKGRELVKRSYKLFCEVDSSMFDGFTDAELETYISCLEKLQGNIRKQCERKENR